MVVKRTILTAPLELKEMTKHTDVALLALSDFDEVMNCT